MAGARAPGLSSASLTIAFLDWAVGFFFFLVLISTAIVQHL